MKQFGRADRRAWLEILASIKKTAVERQQLYAGQNDAACTAAGGGVESWKNEVISCQKVAIVAGGLVAGVKHHGVEPVSGHGSVAEQAQHRVFGLQRFDDGTRIVGGGVVKDNDLVGLLSAG